MIGSRFSGKADAPERASFLISRMSEFCKARHVRFRGNLEAKSRRYCATYTMSNQNKTSAEGDRDPFRFGPFEYDLRKRSLMREGIPIPGVKGIALKGLDYVLRNHDRLVSYDELVAVMWGERERERAKNEDRGAKSDNAVQKCLRPIFDILEHGGHKFIESLRGEGYRFMPLPQPMRISFERTSRTGHLEMAPEAKHAPRTEGDALTSGGRVWNEGANDVGGWDPRLSYLLSSARQLFPAIPDERTKQAQNLQIDHNDAHKGDDVVASYTQALIGEIQNNLVLELYERSHYEDLCITPLVQAVDPGGRFADIHDVSQLVSLGRCAILGEPGSGKTTALRLLVLDLLRRSPLLEIPVYLPLAAFEHFANEDHANFGDFIDTEISLLGCKSLDGLRLASQAEPILLLDGWDEIGEASQQAIKRYLNKTQARFILTTRPEGQRTLPSVDRFEMYPLTVERMREFIKLRIKDSNQADDLLSWISGNPQVLDLARNPLNLSILGIVFLEQGAVSRLTKTRLFERAFEAILEQHHKLHLHPHHSSFMEGDDLSLRIDDVLGALAYQTARHGDGRFFSTKELRSACAGILDKIPFDFAAILAGRLGIIRDRRSGRFEFFHTWYQEFLTARYIVHFGKDAVAEFKHPRLAASLAFAVGLIDSADAARDLLERVPIIDVFNYCRAISEGVFSQRDIERLLDRAIAFGEDRRPPLPVRIELARALANAGSGTIPALTDIAKSEARSDYARRAALEAISSLSGSSEAFENLLVELLRTNSEGLLWHVMEHVGHRRVAKGRAILEKYATHTHPITSAGAIWALRKISNSDHPDIPDHLREQLLGCLQSADEHMRGHALRLIGRLRMTEACKALAAYLVRSDVEYRWIVPEAAGLIGGRQGLMILEQALDDHDSRVVAAALQGLVTADGDLTSELLKKIEKHEQNDTWVPSFEQTLGNLARTSLSKLKFGSTPDNLATIYLARHCTTSWSAERRLQGTMDLPLSEIGIREAQANVSHLHRLGIGRIICSTARRAFETARIYSTALDVPLHRTPRLRELDHGDWEGQQIQQLKASQSSEYASWLQDPGSVSIPGSKETAESAQQRILEAIRDIALSFRGETVLVVAHKHIIALLKCGLAKAPLSEFGKFIVDDSLSHRVNTKDVIRLCEVSNRIPSLYEKR